VWRTPWGIIVQFVTRSILFLPFPFSMFSFKQTFSIRHWKQESILRWLYCVATVPFWLIERYNCYEMWPHNALWMLPWDDKACQVSILLTIWQLFRLESIVSAVILTRLGVWLSYCCPICSKSVIDMSTAWKRIDEEVAD